MTPVRPLLVAEVVLVRADNNESADGRVQLVTSSDTGAVDTVPLELAEALRRLLDLGLLPGTPVRALRRAPLGDPGVYELRGYRLCLRRSESDRVQVRGG